MQVNPIEVLDLLDLIGLPDAWRNPDSFVRYFQSTHLPYEDVEWETIQPMLRAHLERWGWGESERQLTRDLGPVGAARLRNALTSPSAHPMRTLGEDERRAVMRLMRTNNPVISCIHRHTRELLREYHRQGLISQRIATRRPNVVWLDMSDAESELYSDVEDYISYYYNQYEEQRRGLGFVMTIYRRRLTSGLYALSESLKRRRRYLLGHSDQEHPQGLLEEDFEDDDLNDDVGDDIDAPAQLRSDEASEVNRLLRKLDSLPSETKLERVLGAINSELTRTDQVIIFTQYTDTMDNLRDHLRPVYGRLLGCYSGRGGERWNPDTQTWAGTSKDRLQQEFAEGQIKVLVCTDAAAEGLNLQNCSSMINYDMPWNPMKVEQRIGRIDRIGQRRPEVRIRHFMYRGTVEADVYSALGDRIDWFETVVGDLQPILQSAQSTISRAAMVVGAEREEVIRQGIESLRQQIEPNDGPMAGWSPASDPPKSDAPLTLDALAETVHDLNPWKTQVQPTEVDGAFQLKDGSRDLTFDRSVAEHEEVTLCTYNVPEFDRLMALPDPRPRPNIVRLESGRDGKTVGYYGWDDRWRKIASLSALRTQLERPLARENQDIDVTQAKRMFQNSLR